MAKKRFVKIKDVTGETYEFENCDMYTFIGKVVVYQPVPLGTLQKSFYKKNIIFIEVLGYEEDKNG